MLATWVKTLYINVDEVQKLLQSATRFITNCDRYYKVGWIYYKLRQVLQSAMIITNCDSTDVFTGNRGYTACVVKNSYRNALDLNCNFYVTEAILAKKKMYAFSRLPSCSSKGRRNMNLKSKTTNGFNFRIINSLMAMNLGREAWPGLRIGSTVVSNLQH